ncbi:MAG TPA: elongation factor P [Solirubrobacteraceae bacterium]
MPVPPTNEWRVCQLEADKLAIRPDVLIARRAASAWGVLSLDELFACGLSRNAVMNRVRNGRLHPVHRGVYAVGHADLRLEGRFLAAVKACRTGVLSHFSAAALWGFIPWEERHPEVTVVGAARPVRRGIRVHRTTRLDLDDRTRHRAIPVTSPARTLLDLAATLDHRPLRAATRRAQSLYRVNVRQLAATLARHERRRGAARLAEIIATGPAPTKTELEDVVLDLILRGGHVHPDVNVPYFVGARRTVPDFRWPEQRLVVEADGAAWHDHRLAREDDAERQALLEAHGERVLRVTWTQAITRPSATLDRLRAAGAPYTERPMISTNQLKNGNHIEVDGTVFKVLEFQHVKPGKGGAFVRTKLRRASDGNVIDKTFRAGEKFRAVRTEARKMTFLYTDGTDAHFMDAESYEQMAVPEPTVAEALRWTKPNESVDVLFIDGAPSDLQLPASVVLEVSQTDPGLRGDTASGGGTKPATLETGATINVPLFVDIGDSVKVDTRSGEYMSRA